MSIDRTSARFDEELCAREPIAITRNGRRRLAILLFLGCASAAWVQAGDKPATLHPELRAAALAKFAFKLGDAERPASPVLLDKPSPTEDADIVELEKVEVTDTYFGRGLESAVKRTSGAQPKTQRTLGTGVFEKDFGHVRMNAITVLYVPVLVGFSW